MMISRKPRFFVSTIKGLNYIHKYRERSLNNPRQMAQELQKLVTDHSLAGFVVGHPPFKRGRPDPTDRVMDFVVELGWTGVLSEVPYILWDNSYASEHAKDLLYPIRLEPNDARRFVSKFAATDVLQAFLDAGMRHEKYVNLQRGELFVPDNIFRDFY